MGKGRLLAAKRHGTDQIDFRMDAKGVTPIPAIHQLDSERGTRRTTNKKDRFEFREIL